MSTNECRAARHSNVQCQMFSQLLSAELFHLFVLNIFVHQCIIKPVLVGRISMKQ